MNETPNLHQFIDSDSVNRPALERIFCHYGIQDKLIFIIMMLYTDLHAIVICETNLTDYFKLETVVKQRSLLSPFSTHIALTDHERNHQIKNKDTGTS